jgi:hypothetical protein
VRNPADTAAGRAYRAAIYQYGTATMPLQLCKCQLDFTLQAAAFTMRHPDYPEPARQVLLPLLQEWGLRLTPGGECPGEIALMDLELSVLQLTMLTGTVQAALRCSHVPPCVRQVLVSLLDHWIMAGHRIDPRLGAGMALGNDLTYDVPVVTPTPAPRRCARLLLWCRGCGMRMDPCGCGAPHETRHVERCGSCHGAQAN